MNAPYRKARPWETRRFYETQWINKRIPYPRTKGQIVGKWMKRKFSYYVGKILPFNFESFPEGFVTCHSVCQLNGCENACFLGGPICSSHAISLLGLEIRPSKIENAGLGLFATRPFTKGEMMDIYGGDVLTPEQFGQRYPKGFAPYTIKHVIDVKQGTYVYYIDGKNTNTSYTRYANDGNKSGLPCNAQFESNDCFVYMESTKKIEVGDEVLVDYGKSYWIAEEEQKNSRN